MTCNGFHRPFKLAAALLGMAAGLFAPHARAQVPSVSANGVLNAASYVLPGKPGNAVAPGSLVAIFGANFAGSGELFQAAGIPLPTQLGGVSVTFNGVAAPLLFVTAGQINAQLPWEVPAAGAVNVVVTRNGASSSPQAVQVATYSPGLFTVTANGIGQAIALNYTDGSVPQPGSTVLGRPAHPAHPGDVLILYGTGFGPVTPPATTGQSSADALRNTQAPATVLVGGKPATVLFSGLSPQFVGVNQLNITVPQGVASGDSVPVQLQIGGVAPENLVTIAITGVPTAPTVSSTAFPSRILRTLGNPLLGQAIWYSWQPYFWDFTAQHSYPAAAAAFQALNPGLIGHYPGVGVITHDFNWKKLIGPLSSRSDPTPRESLYDTPRGLEGGPDEYGKLVEEFRKTTGQAVPGSIQVNIYGSAQDAADWVEYMNAPNDGSNPNGGTDWASVRAANGHPAPYNIHYWELGNEPNYTAENIGSMTAWQYLGQIQAFVPLMKKADPSIEIGAYTNPFYIGTDGSSRLGTPVPDTLAGPDPSGQDAASNLTWSQAVIRHAGSLLDFLYFHWYGGWNTAVSDYNFVATSMYTGLIPWLDRLQQDIQNFAPTSQDRTRLQQKLAIAEWNIFGGFTPPIGAGTALEGAVADSRTLHVLAARPEVIYATHLGLAAPFPDPPLPAALETRPGYFLLHERNDGAELFPTAAAGVFQLWSRALQPNVATVSNAALPTNATGTPMLDITAMTSNNGNTFNVVLTNATGEIVPVSLTVDSYVLDNQATLLTLTSPSLSDNNSYTAPTFVAVQQQPLTVLGNQINVLLSPYSVTAILSTGRTP